MKDPANPRVEIDARLGHPTTCKVWAGDHLIFTGVELLAAAHYQLPLPIDIQMEAGVEKYEDDDDAREFLGEMVGGGLIDELADAARRHGVMITVSVMPYDADEEPPVITELPTGAVHLSP